MSNEARSRWSQKKCPFGVGDDSGKCCTTDCAAWKEWELDTRESGTVTDTKIEDHRPGWFSDWYVIESWDIGGCREDRDDPEGKQGRWIPEGKRYKWGRDRKVSSGEYSSGGYCKRLSES